MFISSLNNNICKKNQLSINSLPNYTTHCQFHKNNTSTIYEQILFWPTQSFLHHIHDISHLFTNTIVIHNNLGIPSYSDRKISHFPYNAVYVHIINLCVHTNTNALVYYNLGEPTISWYQNIQIIMQRHDK